MHSKTNNRLDDRHVKLNMGLLESNGRQSLCLIPMPTQPMSKNSKAYSVKPVLSL